MHPSHTVGRDFKEHQFWCITNSWSGCKGDEQREEFTSSSCHFSNSYQSSWFFFFFLERAALNKITRRGVALIASSHFLNTIGHNCQSSNREQIAEQTHLLLPIPESPFVYQHSHQKITGTQRLSLFCKKKERESCPCQFLNHPLNHPQRHSVQIPPPRSVTLIHQCQKWSIISWLFLTLSLTSARLLQTYPTRWQSHGSDSCSCTLGLFFPFYFAEKFGCCFDWHSEPVSGQTGVNVNHVRHWHIVGTFYVSLYCSCSNPFMWRPHIFHTHTRYILNLQHPCGPFLMFCEALMTHTLCLYCTPPV